MKSKIETLLGLSEARLQQLLDEHDLGDAKPIATGELDLGDMSASELRVVRSETGESFLLLRRVVLGHPSFEALRRALGEGLLTSRVVAANLGLTPLPVVVASALSARMIERLEAYVDRIAAGSSWGAIDPHGPVLLRLGQRALTLQHGTPRKANARDRTVTPFSPQAQWLLKVLLAPTIDERYLQAPREVPHSNVDLARMTGLSASTVSRVLNGLRRMGFLARGGEPFHLVRLPALLTAWRGVTGTTTREFGARFRLPAADPLAALKSKVVQNERQPRACLGLFAACRQLGVGHVEGAPIHIYCEDPTSAALDALGLRPAEPGERADVFVRQPHAVDAVFKAAPVVDGVPTADALQCWLDVFDHPVRGREQADMLMSALRLIDEDVT
jgi:CRP-like cAMP-binding protein